MNQINHHFLFSSKTSTLTCCTLERENLEMGKMNVISSYVRCHEFGRAIIAIAFFPVFFLKCEVRIEIRLIVENFRSILQVNLHHFLSFLLPFSFFEMSILCDSVLQNYFSGLLT